MIKKLYTQVMAYVHTPYADAVLALCSFLESLIFPPVAPLFIMFCIEKRHRSFFYAALVTIMSVLGGIVAYAIGLVFFQALGQKLITYSGMQAPFNELVLRYRAQETFVVLIGSFMPVPYRLISLGAGFCKLPLASFVTYSLVGRAARYYLVAGVTFFAGDQIKQAIDHWFNYLVLLFVVCMALGFGYLFMLL